MHSEALGSTSSRKRIGSMRDQTTERIPMLVTILVIVLILALIGAFPAWPHAAGYGYGPSGAIGLVLVVVLILVLLGRI